MLGQLAREGTLLKKSSSAYEPGASLEGGCIVTARRTVLRRSRVHVAPAIVYSVAAHSGVSKAGAWTSIIEWPKQVELVHGATSISAGESPVDRRGFSFSEPELGPPSSIFMFFSLL